MSTGALSLEIIGDRIKAKQEKPRPERPIRPELSEEQRDELLRLWQALDTENEEEREDFKEELLKYSYELIHDSVDRKRLQEKLSRTIAKSNRRRNQLRQQGKTVELYAANLQNLRRVSVENAREGLAQQRHILDLQNQIREERAGRRRAEDELYQMRRALPASSGHNP